MRRAGSWAHNFLRIPLTTNIEPIRTPTRLALEDQFTHCLTCFLGLQPLKYDALLQGFSCRKVGPCRTPRGDLEGWCGTREQGCERSLSRCGWGNGGWWLPTEITSNHCKKKLCQDSDVLHWLTCRNSCQYCQLSTNSCQQNAMPIPSRNYQPAWMQAPKLGCGQKPSTISLGVALETSSISRWDF